jgi:hypothetical protein
MHAISPHHAGDHHLRMGWGSNDKVHCRDMCLEWVIHSVNAPVHSHCVRFRSTTLFTYTPMLGDGYCHSLLTKAS